SSRPMRYQTRRSTMTKQGTPPDEITEAEEAVAEAEQAVAEIETRLLDGDTEVSAADLLAAEDAIGERRRVLGRLREIRRRRDEAAAEAERQRRLAAVRQEVADRIHSAAGLAPIVEAFDAALEALL